MKICVSSVRTVRQGGYVQCGAELHTMRSADLADGADANSPTLSAPENEGLRAPKPVSDRESEMPKNPTKPGAMSPAAIVERARRCGVSLTFAAAGTGLSL